ncbi:MAG TPA: calcium/sodium antiporter [Thermohalobaculum sp.]|nr:calcium/sodium antiporter [Thermohalobaculum sp.]
MLILELGAGLVLLLLGGESLVRGAAGFAARMGVSPLLIGLTVVGFGTSTPELVTSLEAAFAGSPGIAIGNVVGSNTANILLILGVAAVLVPIPVARRAFLRDGTVAALAALACLGVVLMGSLERLAGVALVAMLAGYIVFAASRERVEVAEGDGIIPRGMGVPAALAFALGGLVLTILGARLLVGGAIELAEVAGVSDTIIGLTIVAVGTSLPELATSLMAALRRQPEIAFGNIVGSNIYNVFGILGVTALVHPIPVPPEIAAFDIWVMLAATAALTAAAVTGWRITRREGAAMLAAYAVYIGVLAAG